MKIYIDFILLINFLFDFILLIGISITLKRNVKIYRIILGSIFGAFTIFIMFLNISPFLYFILKMLSGIIMLIITFNYKDLKYTIYNLLYLMILSVIVAGSLYLLNIELGYENVGMIFFTNGSNTNIILLFLVAILVILIYIKILQKYKNNISKYHKVNLYLKNKILYLNGYVDTGNVLRDPYFLKPILIVNKNIKIESEKFIIVPFETLNSKGLLKGYLVDKVYISDIGYFYNVYVARAPNDFNLNGADIILNNSLWEEK